jgi:hypothetical protein
MDWIVKSKIIAAWRLKPILASLKMCPFMSEASPNPRCTRLTDAASLGESLSIFTEDPPTFLSMAQTEKASPNNTRTYSSFSRITGIETLLFMAKKLFDLSFYFRIRVRYKQK